MFTHSNSTNISLSIESTWVISSDQASTPVFILLLLIRSDKLVYFGCL